MEEQFQKRADRFFKHCLKIRTELEVPDKAVAVCEEKLEELEFPLGEERMIAAWYLAGNQEGKDIETICKRMKILQKNIAGFYPRRTDSSGWTAALLLAVSGIKVPEFQQRMHRIRELLQKWMPGESRLQDIANVVLLFQVDDIALCERGIHVYQAFRKRGWPLDSHHAAAVAGLLALSKEPADRLAEFLIEAAEQWEPKEKDGGVSIKDPYLRLAVAAGSYLHGEAEGGKAGKLSSVALESAEMNFLEVLNTICLCCMVDPQI